MSVLNFDITDPVNASSIPVVFGDSVFNTLSNSAVTALPAQHAKNDDNLPLGHNLGAAHELAQLDLSSLSAESSPEVNSMITPSELYSMTDSLLFSLPDDFSSVVDSITNTPMFGDDVSIEDNQVDEDPKNWTSLFVDEDHNQTPTVADDVSVPLPSKKSIDSMVADVMNVANNMILCSPSEPLEAPVAPKQEHSSPRLSAKDFVSKVEKPDSKIDHLGCVQYNRKKRSAPLSPVVIPSNGDVTAIKRAKNTEAARRSRAKKMQRMKQLEQKVEELLKINSDLVGEVERLKLLLG